MLPRLNSNDIRSIVVNREVNHAAQELGAVVLGALTTASYSDTKTKKNTGGGWFWSSPNTEHSSCASDYRPEIALKYPVETGRCWRFAGPVGHLGIQLSAPVRLDYITVAHIPLDLAFNYTIAPQDFQVWGVADNSARYSDDNIEELCAKEHSPCDYLRNYIVGTSERARLELSNKRVVNLGQFHYNISNIDVYQRFPVTYPKQFEDVRFHRVIFAFSSNWGSDDYTCIYNVGVYGQR